MITAGSGGGGKGSSTKSLGSCILKKGPWMAAEDGILTEYVRKHGEGNWNAVQKHTGLMRCGKSCRLRWANHLRPNLKKGAFSPEEERIIIELHAKLGNKWARMAAQLPGRTDNEIKNYWNTRMKRRQRAGLPLYPQEVQEEAAAFHQLEQEFDDHQPPNKRHHSSSPSSPITSLLISSTTTATRKPTNDYNNISNTPFLINNHAFNFSSPSTNNSLQLNNHPNIIFSDTQFKLGTNNNINNSSPYVKPLSSSSSSLYNNNNNSQTLIAPSMNHHHHPISQTLYQLNSSNANDPIPLHQFAASFDPNLMCFSSLLNMGATNIPPAALNPNYVQSTIRSTNTNTNKNNNNNNGGLLDSLLHTLSSPNYNDNNVKEEINNKMVAAEAVSDEKEKGAPVDSSADDNEEEGDGENVQSNLVNDGGQGKAEVQWENLSFSHSSKVLNKTDEDPPEVMNSIDDDDLQSLLTNFPSAMPPVPDWYPNAETSNGSSSSIINHEAGLTINANDPAAPPPPPVLTTTSSCRHS